MKARISKLQSERDELMSELNFVGREIMKYKGIVGKIDDAVVWVHDRA
jgi:hypothetical protein